MLNIEAVFIDIDGTLLKGKNKKLNEKDRLDIKRVLKKNIYVILNTGRPLSRIANVWEQIKTPKYTRYLISSNGSIIWDMELNKIIYEKLIDKDTFYELGKYLYENNFIFKNSKNNVFYGEKSFLTKILNASKKMIVSHELDTFEHNKDSSQKIGAIISFSKKVVKNKVREIEEKFPNLEVTISGPGLYIEITQKDVTKGNAIKFLAKRIGLNLNNTIHIGDSLNDLSAFKVVGYGVAMKNSMKIIKKESDFITKSYKKAGVSVALNDLILNSEIKK